jgi:hypothetical protein
MPEHHEAHAGPYGVEMPPDWSFAITITEVTIEVGGGAQPNEGEVGTSGAGKS